MIQLRSTLTIHAPCTQQGIKSSQWTTQTYFTQSQCPALQTHTLWLKSRMAPGFPTAKKRQAIKGPLALIEHTFLSGYCQRVNVTKCIYSSTALQSNFEVLALYLSKVSMLCNFRGTYCTFYFTFYNTVNYSNFINKYLTHFLHNIYVFIYIFLILIL